MNRRPEVIPGSVRYFIMNLEYTLLIHGKMVKYGFPDDAKDLFDMVSFIK